MKSYIRFIGCLSLALFSFLLTACNSSSDKMTSKEVAQAEGMLAMKGLDRDYVALIKTNYGNMVIGFWSNEAPETVKNFKTLATKGFYDGTSFHRIVKGFMIQGGDPLTKDPSKEKLWGTGDPGYKIKAEFNQHSHEYGVISMARSADINSAGSQFFICLENARGLDGKYTAFGCLVSGKETLDKIAAIPCDLTPNRERSKPTKRVEVEYVRIIPVTLL